MRMLRRGFTLIEVLVSVGVIAALAGLVLSALGGANDKSRQTTCASNIRQLVTASLMYAHDHDGRFPPFINVSPGPECNAVSKMSSHTNGQCAPDLMCTALKPYVGDDRLYFCPSDPLARKDTPEWMVDHKYSSYVFAFSWDMTRSVDGLYWKGKLTDPATAVLVCDPFVADAGPGGYSHSGGFNVGYVDGHVKLHVPQLH